MFIPNTGGVQFTMRYAIAFILILLAVGATARHDTGQEHRKKAKRPEFQKCKAACHTVADRPDPVKRDQAREVVTTATSSFDIRYGNALIETSTADSVNGFNNRDNGLYKERPSTSKGHIPGTEGSASLGGGRVLVNRTAGDGIDDDDDDSPASNRTKNPNSGGGGRPDDVGPKHNKTRVSCNETSTNATVDDCEEQKKNRTRPNNGGGQGGGKGGGKGGGRPARRTRMVSPRELDLDPLYTLFTYGNVGGNDTSVGVDISMTTLVFDIEACQNVDATLLDVRLNLNITDLPQEHADDATSIHMLQGNWSQVPVNATDFPVEGTHTERWEAFHNSETGHPIFRGAIPIFEPFSPFMYGQGMVILSMRHTPLMDLITTTKATGREVALAIRCGHGLYDTDCLKAADAAREYGFNVATTSLSAIWSQPCT